MDDVFQQFLTSDITYLEVRERERETGCLFDLFSSQNHPRPENTRKAFDHPLQTTLGQKKQSNICELTHVTECTFEIFAVSYHKGVGF